MINKELQHIAPLLSGIKERGLDSGFSIPENYFNNFENRIILENKSNTLKQSIPENYFENFENTVFKRLKKEKQENTIVYLTKRQLIGIIAIAASFLFLLTIYDPFKGDNSIAASEIESYLTEGTIDLETYEIADAFTDLNIDTLDMENQISQKEIENYLLDEISDENFYN